jgi:CRISPR-associated endonuclease/helicase Cas3
MVSDLAPVDLLLQRAGRLHRHDRSRPPRLEKPWLWLYERHSADGSLNLSGDKYVYAEYLLLKTYDAIEKRSLIDLPSDYRTLIETVYNAPTPTAESPLAKTWKEMQTKQQSASDLAAQRLLPDPKADETFASVIANNSFEESEDRAGWLIAQTRLGERSLTVIPMRKQGASVACLGVDGLFVPAKPLARHYQLSFLRRSIRISQREVIAALEEINKDQLPVLFKNSALLKDTFPLWLEEDGKAEIQTQAGQYHVELNAILGLLINKG